MKEKFVFEVLCVETKSVTGIANENNLIFSLMANSDLWITPVLEKKNTIINDIKQEILLNVKIINVEDKIDNALKTTFVVKVEGNYSSLEKFRLKLISYLKGQCFNTIYILLDEISMNIACEIYPMINKIENAMRKYIVKFFVTKLGANWWNVTADSEMNKKTVSRKNNETVFGSLIDNKAYLIDFGELGKIVYQQSSGFLNKEDIINKIMNLDENEIAIKSLKNQLQNNYTKFFKDTFKDKGFQQKWEFLEKIRHKTAHNSLFVIDDLLDCKKMHDEMCEIISQADESIDKIVFSSDEKEAFRDNIVQNSAYKVITETELVRKLEQSEKWVEDKITSGNDDAFIGFHSFVRNYLGSAGYDYTSSYHVLNQLIEKGEIEVYQYESYNSEFPIKSIRRVKENSVL